MPEPVELPVDAKKCPFCGKAKWLSRIWSGYSIGVISTTAPEALPRMSHEDIQRTDRLAETARASQSAPQKRFFVAPGYEVKAVSMGRVGHAVGELAGQTGGEQAARAVAGSVDASLKSRAGRSSVERGEARALSAEEKHGVAPPRQRMQVVAKWTPSEKEIASAAKDAMRTA